MKKRLLAGVLCALMISSTACADDSSSSSADSAKSAPKAATKPMSAAEVADNMNLGLNLGNTMEAYDATDCATVEYEWIPIVKSNAPTDYEMCWGAVETTQEVIDGIKEAGFDTIRIPVFWGNMMENDGTWTINKDYIARVREIVDYAQNAGLYTVINCHHFDEFIIRRNDLDSCKTIFNTLWTQIADYFKDYPYTVVFEGFNEYLGGDQFDENGELKPQNSRDAFKMTNSLNQTFVDAVRATGGNNADRVLIVSGYWTNIDKTTSKNFVMPTDSATDKLMVSVHYVDNEKYWTNQIGSQEWLDYIDAQCDELISAFKDKNIPVFLGETTAIYPDSNFDSNAIYTDSSECLEIVLNKLTDLGFVPVIWDVNDNFYSRTEFKVKNDSDAEVIKKVADKIK